MVSLRRHKTLLDFPRVAGRVASSIPRRQFPVVDSPSSIPRRRFPVVDSPSSIPRRRFDACDSRLTRARAPVCSPRRDTSHRLSDGQLDDRVWFEAYRAPRRDTLRPLARRGRPLGDSDSVAIPRLGDAFVVVAAHARTFRGRGSRVSALGLGFGRRDAKGVVVVEVQVRADDVAGGDSTSRSQLRRRGTRMTDERSDGSSVTGTRRGPGGGSSRAPHSGRRPPGRALGGRGCRRRRGSARCRGRTRPRTRTCADVDGFGARPRLGVRGVRDERLVAAPRRGAPGLSSSQRTYALGTTATRRHATT